MAGEQSAATSTTTTAAASTWRSKCRQPVTLRKCSETPLFTKWVLDTPSRGRLWFRAKNRHEATHLAHVFTRSPRINLANYVLIPAHVKLHVSGRTGEATDDLDWCHVFTQRGTCGIVAGLHRKAIRKPAAEARQSAHHLQSDTGLNYL